MEKALVEGILERAGKGAVLVSLVCSVALTPGCGFDVRFFEKDKGINIIRFGVYTLEEKEKEEKENPYSQFNPGFEKMLREYERENP